MDFETIVRTHQGMVYGIAYNFFNNGALAEEVAQDVFLKLYENGRGIQSPPHLIRWLRKATTHRSIDILRRKSMRNEIQMEIVPEVPADSTETDPLMDARLRRLVASLPEKQRAVVVLRFGEGMEIGEIGRVLDVPDRTVRTHLQRAVTRMRSETSELQVEVRAK